MQRERCGCALHVLYIYIHNVLRDTCFFQPVVALLATVRCLIFMWAIFSKWESLSAAWFLDFLKLVYVRMPYEPGLAYPERSEHDSWFPRRAYVSNGLKSTTRWSWISRMTIRGSFLWFEISFFNDWFLGNMEDSRRHTVCRWLNGEAIEWYCFLGGLGLLWNTIEGVCLFRSYDFPFGSS